MSCTSKLHVTKRKPYVENQTRQWSVSGTKLKDSALIENQGVERMNEVIPMQSKQPEFQDVKAAAAVLRLKPRTVYDMVSNGRIPYRKARDRTIFFLDEILNWIKPGEES